MPDPLAPAELASFGPYRVDFRAGELRKNGRKIRLQDQPLQILAVLIENPGEVVTRDQLRHKLWPGNTFVDFDHGLNNAINRLREALNDSVEEPRFIETLPRRGYRFVAKVEGDGNRTSPESPLGVIPEAEETAGAVVEPTVAENASSIRQVRTFWWGVAGAGVATALTFFVYFAVGGNFRGGAGKRITSVAVLPLENLSGGAEQEYFADGMTDELITDLASIGSLRVISRTSTSHYKGTRKTLPEIARELNVDAVVEGSVSRSANKVRIRAQLVRAAPEEHLWAESYERDLADVLVLQRDVATAIAGEIKINLTPREKAWLASARPINPDAYNSYLLGTYHSDKRSPASIAKGIGYLQEAIRIDPKYAQAYAGLANAYLERDIWGGLGVGMSAAPIRANTLKALELDGDLADAHVLMGQIHFQHDWDWQGAEVEYKRAIELNPNLAYTYNRYAYLLQVVGRHEEAIATAHRAVELDPLSAQNLCDEGRILFRERQYENAIARYRRALELDSSYPPALSRMADAYELLGNHAEALNYTEKWQRALGEGSPDLPSLAVIYARMGRRREAAELLRKIEKAPSPGGDGFALAMIYSALGDREHAIAALEKGVHARSVLPIVFVDPRLDPIHADPRYKELVRRAGLPEAEGR